MSLKTLIETQKNYRELGACDRYRRLTSRASSVGPVGQSRDSFEDWAAPERTQRPKDRSLPVLGTADLLAQRHCA
ncbi:hypothetical protein [Streptomyces sp. NPDC090053]|uniref:hypothetical protein n=1 Tax=Streptomyces sp. NPDC090053 TaxID=3365932 RepID=UPI0037F4AB3F